MKTAKDYLDEANAVVKKISVNEAIEKHKSKSAIFIDAREPEDFENGHIKQSKTQKLRLLKLVGFFFKVIVPQLEVEVGKILDVKCVIISKSDAN